jgi:apolipoprotein N-acyltransferase
MHTEVEILNGETLYVRFGDWFAWSLAAIAAGLVLFRAKRRLRKI